MFATLLMCVPLILKIAYTLTCVCLWTDTNVNGVWETPYRRHAMLFPTGYKSYPRFAPASVVEDTF